MAERELPPLRVKLLGDKSDFDKMVSGAKKGAEDLGKAVDSINKSIKSSGKAAKDAEQERIFHNYRLLEKSKQVLFDREVFNTQVLQKQKDAQFAKELQNEVLLEKAKATRFKAELQNLVMLEKAKDSEFQRAIQNEILLEKQRTAEFNRQLQNEILLEKQREADVARQFQNLQLLEKAKEAEFNRQLQNEILLEKQRDADAQREFQNLVLLEKAKEADFQRQLQNEVLLEKQREAAFERSFANEVLLEKQRNSEFDREFQNLQILEKAREVAFQREFNNELLLEKQRESAFNARLARLKKIDATYRQERESEDAAAAKAHKEEQARMAEARRFEAQRAEALTKGVEVANKAQAKATQEQMDKVRKYWDLYHKKNEENRKEAERAKNEVVLREKQKTEALRRETERRHRILEKAKMDASRSTGRRGMGGGFGAAALGDRADIYMHTNALQGMVSAVKSFASTAIDIEKMSVKMEVFTGSAAQGAQMLAELRKQAASAPYSLRDLSQSTQVLMSYGVGSKDAMDTQRRLQDVAHGDAQALYLLSRAMGQITSLGRLQGDELNQLTEHGFNPLETISRKTGMSMKDLETAKRQGLITSKMVHAALAIETSAGGRFEGMVQKMARTVEGLGKQLYSLGQEINAVLFQPLEEDIKRILTTSRGYLLAVYRMLKAHPELVKQYAKLAVQVFGAVVGFHMLALGMAIVRWNMVQVVSILKVFGLGLRLVTSITQGAVGLMTGAFRNLRLVMLTVWATGTLPITAIIAGILALHAAVLGLIVHFRHPQGLIGAFKDAGKSAFAFVRDAVGFMANFQHNFAVVSKYLSDNWGAILNYMAKAWALMLQVHGHNTAVFAAFILRMLNLAFQQVATSAPIIFGHMLDAMYNKFVDFYDKIVKDLSDLFSNATSPKSWAKFVARRAMANMESNPITGMPIRAAKSAWGMAGKFAPGLQHSANSWFKGFIGPSKGLSKKVVGDTKLFDTEGFLSAALGVAKDSAKGLRNPFAELMGLAGKTLPGMEGLKFDLGMANPLDKMKQDLESLIGLKPEDLKLPDISIPAAPEVDWKSLFEEGQEQADKNPIQMPVVPVAIQSGTAQEAVMQWEAMQRMQGNIKAGSDKGKKDELMQRILEKIEKNTRPAGPGAQLNQANLVGAS